MSTPKLKFLTCQTNAGMIYQFEEEYEKQQIIYYAYELSSDFEEACFKEEAKIKNCKSIRQHVKYILYQNKRCILFKYMDGETLDKRILEFRAKQESINIETIKLYLIQILDTLYYLHNNYILGRVFSTKNILDCNGKLLFLDFGFGPKMMAYNLDLIAPPEIIQNFIEKDQSHQLYNMKVDSWLLGAVLYHLVKLSPINAVEIENQQVKIMLYQHVQEYYTYLKNQMQKQKHIETLTIRYPKEFCYFIQGLLTYDPNNRLSFLQIYNHDFIKNLNIPNYSQYLKFYEQYNEQELIKQIKINEDHGSKIFETGKLAQGLEQQQQNIVQITLNQEHIPQLNLDSETNLASDIKIIPPTSSRVTDNIQWADKDDIEKLFLHQMQILKNSKFYQIWQHIRMELFRFTFLELSAAELILELQKKQFQLEHVCSYSLIKMGYLILIELQKKINEDVCPWRCHQQDQQKWKDFQKELQKEILENNIKKAILDLEPILKETYFKHCKIYLEDERIDKTIRDELQADLKCFQMQKVDGNSIYKSCTDEFLKKGYRQIILTTYKFLEREQVLAQQPELKYNTLLLKITVCHLINRIFNLNTVEYIFGNLLPIRQSLITPNEVYQYICRDAEDEKIKDIQHIVKANFKSD